MLSAGTNMDVYRLEKMRLEVLLNRPKAVVRERPHRVATGTRRHATIVGALQIVLTECTR